MPAEGYDVLTLPDDIIKMLKDAKGKEEDDAGRRILWSEFFIELLKRRGEGNG